MRINRSSRLYRIALWLLLAASLAALWQLNARVLSHPAYIPVDDFSHYWGAGRLLLSGENPYDSQRIQALKNEVAGMQDDPETIPIMWTPPWSLPIVMPFGWLDYPLSRLLWLLANIAVILVCCSQVWQHYADAPKYPWLPWLIGFTFAPTISVLEKGQITPWMLLGMIGFMVSLERKQNELAAGAFAALIALKPQSFYLFWLALALWALSSRRWKVILACGLTLLAATLLPSLFNRQVAPQYIQAFMAEAPTVWATPTLGAYLRLFFGVEKTWLQFLPMLIGSIWCLSHYRINRRRWRWSEQMPLLMLVSFVFAGYGWTYDQVLSLIAVLPVFALVARQPWSRRHAWLLGLYLLITLLDLFLHRWLDEFWFLWLAPALLAWYGMARRWFEPKPMPEAA